MTVKYDQSRLKMDIDDVVAPFDNDSSYHQYFLFEAKLHTVDKDLTINEGIAVNAMRISRDYIDNVADYIEIELIIPIGTFVYDVYEYLDNIEVTLISKKQLGGDKNTIKTRYRAIYLLDKNRNYSNINNQTKNDLNQLTPIVITLQLVDRSVEVIRLKTTYGSFDPIVNKNSDMSITNFLKSVISTETNKIQIENRPPLDALDIETPENTEKLKSINIRSNTRVVELADYIQEYNIGIYAGGVGTYIQTFGIDYTTFKKTYFIYSLYNTSKYDKSKYKMIIYVPNMSTRSLAETISYKYKDLTLRVLSFKTSRIEDNKDSLVMSYGTGFKTSSARSIMKKPVELDGDQNPIFRQEKFVTNIVYDDRLDGINYSPNLGLSSNHFKNTSDILSRKGNYITVEVNHLDPDFICPGAKVKIAFENKNSNIYNVYGVVHKCLIAYSREPSNTVSVLTNARAELYCKMAISVFVSDGGANLDANKTS